MTEPPQGQSADNPFPVRGVAIRVAGWIDKLGAVWVEGQIAQLTLRPNSNTAFITLCGGAHPFQADSAPARDARKGTVEVTPRARVRARNTADGRSALRTAVVRTLAIETVTGTSARQISIPGVAT